MPMPKASEAAPEVVRGEVVDPAERPAPMAQRDAVKLTNRVKKGLDDLDNRGDAVMALLHEAHEGRAWMAMGYSSWAQYTATEFQMSRSRSYQLVNWAELNRELGAEGAALATTEREARRALAARKAKKSAEKDPPVEPAASVYQVDTSTPPDLPERDASVAEERPAPPAVPAASTGRSAPVESSRRAYNRTDLETVIGALIECKPADIRSLDERLFARYGSWVQQAWAVRPAPKVAIAIARSAIRPAPPAASPRARREDTDAGSAKCLHPVTRRIGDRCGACGATTKAGR